MRLIILRHVIVRDLYVLLEILVTEPNHGHLEFTVSLLVIVHALRISHLQAGPDQLFHAIERELIGDEFLDLRLLESERWEPRLGELGIFVDIETGVAAKRPERLHEGVDFALRRPDSQFLRFVAENEPIESKIDVEISFAL